MLKKTILILAIIFSIVLAYYLLESATGKSPTDIQLTSSQPPAKKSVQKQHRNAELLKNEVDRYLSNMELQAVIEKFKCSEKNCELIIRGKYDNKAIVSLMKHIQNAKWNDDLDGELCRGGIQYKAGIRTSHICFNYTAKKENYLEPAPLQKTKTKPVKTQASNNPLSPIIALGQEHSDEIRKVVMRHIKTDVIDELMCAAAICKLTLDHSQPDMTKQVISELNTLPWLDNGTAYVSSFLADNQIRIVLNIFPDSHQDPSSIPNPGSVNFTYDQAADSNIATDTIKNLFNLEPALMNFSRQVECKKNICKLTLHYLKPEDIIPLHTFFSESNYSILQIEMNSIAKPLKSTLYLMQPSL